MVDDHPVFKTPPNNNQKIWRYLDFTKFVDLLTSQSLFFGRVDLFEDVFEGSNPQRTAKMRNAQMAELSKQQVLLKHYSPEFYQEIGIKEKKNNAINCWHMNDFESAAMWKLYVKSNEGIAIQSTYQKLSDCLNKSDLLFHIGMVNYIDYDKDIIDWGNGFLPFVHKRKSFEHEKELRALIWKTESKNIDKVDFLQGGINVNVDIPWLVEKIYVSPDSPLWQTNLVKRITQKLGFNLEIVNSRLNESPIY